jgi:cell division septum initiation protein DivIVA
LIKAQDKLKFLDDLAKKFPYLIQENERLREALGQKQKEADHLSNKAKDLLQENDRIQ